MSVTRLDVRRDPAGGRVRLEMGSGGPRGRGHLAVRVLGRDAEGARVALVAECALLVADDDVRLDLRVGRDVLLEVVEPAGTVAYDMRGGSARWCATVVVADGGRLVWRAQPLVVSSGARVERRVDVALHGSASALLRETIVLGRATECGGCLRQHLRVAGDDGPVLVEDLALDGARPLSGVLAGYRVLDTITMLGRRANGIPTPPRAHRLDLEGEGTMIRSLCAAAHLSPLDEAWTTAADVVASARPSVR